MRLLTYLVTGIVVLSVVSVSISVDTDTYWYDNADGSEYAAASAHYWLEEIGYANTVCGDENDDYLEDQAEEVSVWFYNGHGMCESGSKVRLVCNDDSFWLWYMWVRATDIDGLDASQMLLAFANACDSLDAYDLAEAFVDDAGTDAYIGNVGDLTGAAGINVAKNFTKNCYEDDTISTALAQTVNWWNNEFPDDSVDFYIYGSSSFKLTSARYS